LAVVGLAIRNTRAQLGDRQVPLMGILAAAIFAGQMLNFTIPGGTSGHLLGGALAALFVGPWAAVLVMTAVIAIQALLFQDGGLVVMGLNILNMGIVTSFVGYFAYRAVKDVVKGRPGLITGAVVGGWLSVVVTSAFTAVELAVSGSSPLQMALPAMVGIHVIIGVGEALLTVFALTFVLATRPDLVTGESAPGQRSAAWLMGGLLLALSLTLLAPLASPYPDGLERIAEVFSAPQDVEAAPVGFAVPEQPQFFGEARPAPFTVLPDYTIPVLGQTAFSTTAAGMLGVLVVFGIAYLAAWIVRRGREAQLPPEQSPSKSAP
jgi:cobalt/nickel transport system permease protein